MASRSVKPKREVVKDEKVEDTFPFDLGSTYTNLDDPLGDSTTTTATAQMKAEEEFKTDCEDDDDARLRFHLNSSGNVNCVKRIKVFIIPEGKPIGHRKGGRRPKYANDEERLKARAAMARERRAKMGTEEKEEYLQKTREAKRVWMEKMMKEQVEPLGTEQGQSKTNPNRYEELQMRNREYSRKRRKQIQKDPEKYEELKRRKRENARKRRERLRVENPEKFELEKRKFREWKKRWREQNPEKCEAIRQRDRESKAKSKNKSPRQETEQEKEMKKMRRRRWYRKQMESEEGREMIRFRQYSRVQMKIAQMTDEELAEFKEKQSEAAKKWRENLTGEKLEKYQTYLRNNAKRNHQKRLATMGEAYKAEINARCRHYVANETPEQRQRRLRRYKINQAITRLRKQLEEFEVPPEEVERRVTELKKTMEAEPLPPPETLSKYKPRVKSQLNFSLPPRRTQGGRKCRPPPPGGSRQMDSNSEVADISTCQTGMDDSNDFDHERFIDDDGNEEINTDSNHETSPLEPVSILHFDIKCPHCSSSYSERGDLISHIGSEHSEICWKCPKCKLIVLSSDELSDHYKKEHFPIRNGSTETTASNSVSKETTSSKKNNIFTCIKCDPVQLSSPSEASSFGSVKELMEHVMFNHFESYWPCSKCNLLKYTKSGLKLHERICKTVRKN